MTKAAATTTAVYPAGGLFGDGTRIPLIAVSPFAKKGFVDHTYYDHVSILKFIERNCGLNPLSARS
jgi:phospholipase C